MTTDQKIKDWEIVWKCSACDEHVARGSPHECKKKATCDPEPQSNEGRKDDQGKACFHYLPADALAAINKVLVFGAGKYGDRNWERGMAWLRPANAALRHLFAWMRGERADPETGMSHLWHAGCCILFLITYELRQIGKDDRAAPL